MPDEKIEVLSVDDNSGVKPQPTQNNSLNQPNRSNYNTKRNAPRKLRTNNNRTAKNKSIKGQAGDKLKKTGKVGKDLGNVGKAAGKTAKVAGKGAQVAGKGVKTAGKGIKAGSQALGTAASAIPVVGGAIGAGIRAAGTAANAAAQASGTAAELGGKALDKAGSAVEKGAGKLKNTAGKVEEKGKAMADSEAITKGKPMKAVKAIGKLVIGIVVYLIMHFPLFFLLVILIGAAIDDGSTNYFGTSGITEYYTENAIGNIQKSIINELSQPVPLKDGVEANFTGKNNYGITDGYMHNGIDLNNESIGCNAGDDVLSVYSGQVEEVGKDNSNFEPGYWIKIKHEIEVNGGTAIIYSLYKGIDESTAYYVPGDNIVKNQKIGVISSSGSLHFEIQDQDGNSLDPINVYIPFANTVLISNTVTGNEVIDKVISMITSSTTIDDRIKDNLHISAILGNMYVESHFYVDAIENDEMYTKDQINLNTEGAIGLIQWDFGRQDNLLLYAGAEGSTWYDIDIQLRYLEGELTYENRSSLDSNVSKYTTFNFIDDYEKWLNETNPENAAYLFALRFERCSYPSNPIRKTNTRCWYNLLQNGQGSVDYCMTHDS